jgi:hypothetical protein
MPFQAYAASAKETVETGVNKVLKTLGDPTFKAKPRDVKITEVGTIIGEVFDFTELTRRACRELGLDQDRCWAYTPITPAIIYRGEELGQMINEKDG